MTAKYLLYIDMLGFSELTRNRPDEVRRLYSIIENLNCHKHDAFRVIVFSDTLLVYNLADPFFEYDHRYCVMFLIEFAQDLLYRLAGKNQFFRGVLTYGDFEHAQPRQVERFFGAALLKAYEDEKCIPCTGLFLHSTCQRFNEIFPTAAFNTEYSFVYLNQSLDRLYSGQLGEIPVAKDLLEDSDSQWSLAKDIRYLADVHIAMRSHPDPRVRQKHLMTWDFYSRRYPTLTALLEQNDFDPKCVSPDFDWREAYRRIHEGYRGMDVVPPTFEAFCEIIEEARGLAPKRRESCARRVSERKSQRRTSTFFLAAERE